MPMPTWIRVEDEFGQFDHRKDLPLPKGVVAVEGYPEHVAEIARDGKAFVDLNPDADITDYKRLREPKLIAEIERRNADETVIDLPEGASTEAMIAALEADDEKRAALEDVEDEAPDYRALQQRAKELEIPANQSADELVAAIAAAEAASPPQTPDEPPSVTGSPDPNHAGQPGEGSE